MPTWNPSLYLTFGRERIQPCVDLVQRIVLDAPERIVDLGCGPGNSTAILRGRWPNARITGVDSSAAMLEQARASDVAADWVQGDIASWRPDEPIDLIFSNAALQWVPGHSALLASLLGALRRPGVLAIQIPYHLPSPAHRAILDLCAEPPWNGWLTPPPEPFEIHDPDFYYRLLAPLARRFDAWQTTYIHVLERPAAVADWMRGTGLRPYLERLPEASRNGFLDAYRALMEQVFPPQPDGRALFPFPRLFLLAEL